MPLKGVKVLEMAGLAPVPFCGQILRDFGARVIQVDHVFNPMAALQTFKFGKETVKLDLKSDQGNKILKEIVKAEQIDVFLDPFRPGVLEKMKLGPKELMDLNPGLIFARLSGYGQTGPMKHVAGHDINYVATSGALSFLRSKDGQPRVPINLLADFAGGSFLCSLGIVMALFERTRSGKGQVIDHSMTEGTAYLASFLYESLARQKDIIWPNHPEPEANLLDHGAPFYRCYRTSDDRFIAVGCIEPKFYAEFLKGIDFRDPDGHYSQLDTSQWPEMTDKFAEIIGKKSRDEWSKIFDGTDACVTPVLEPEEVFQLEQHRARGSFANGLPNPAPVMGRTPAARDWNVAEETITRDVLRRLGYNEQDIQRMEDDNLIA